MIEARWRRIGELGRLGAGALSVLALGCAAAGDKTGAVGADAGVSVDGGGGGIEAPDHEPDAGFHVDASAREVSVPCSATAPSVDHDGDGFTPADGDCNDCDPSVNPGAFDYPGNGIDEDCNGKPDDEARECDDGIGEAGDAIEAARAIGICRMASGKSWGLVSARWVAADGTPGIDECGLYGSQKVGSPNPLSRGLLAEFGSVIRPREGKRLLALSSGVAREGSVTPPDPNAGISPMGATMCTRGQVPPGFPKDSPSCPGVTTSGQKDAWNPSGLEVVIRVPTNANALQFAFDFFTYEFPNWVCQKYNDSFVALLQSTSPNTPSDRNISFDKLGGVVSVNNAFVDVCKGPITAGGKTFPCSLGPGELAGTGFELSPEGKPHGASTSWLATTASVVGGETITLRFAIWDAGDQVWDSTVLIDAFSWQVRPGTGSTPVTDPLPR